jgi:hypothetical protein
MRSLYKRYASGGDTTKVKTPMINMAEEIAAYNAGKRGYTPAQRDSVVATFNRPAWLNIVDATGYQPLPFKPVITKPVVTNTSTNNTLVKRMDNGGQTQTRNAVLGQNLAVGASLGSGLIDAVDNGNDLGYQGKGTTIGKGILSGAATGAGIAGPWGAAAGAVIGGISGIIRAGHQATEQTALRSRIKTNNFINDSTNSANRLATNPELLTGSQTAQYFSTGGSIHINPANKGKFNATKATTGKSTEELTHSSNPLTRKRAVFTQNASHWNKKELGGDLFSKEKPKPIKVNPSQAQGLNYVAFPYASNDGMSSTYTLDLNSKTKGPNGFMYNALSPDGTNKVFHESEIPQQYLSNTLQNNYAIQQYGKNGRVEKTDSLYLAPGTSKFGVNLPKKADGGALYQKMKGGGNIADQEVQNGTVTPMSNNTAQVNGPSHQQGGVQLPESGAEVEGGETTSGNFVFSDKLGYAQLHKPIAKAIGIIEKKPQTQDRINALNRLKAHEQELAQHQELYKRMNGIQ